MDWSDVVKYTGTVVASGGTAFIAAWGRFKTKLEEHDKVLAQHAADLIAHRNEYSRDKDHRRELEDVRERERARASRPDPFEDIRKDIDDLQEKVDALKEKSERYVRSDTFANFTKEQEAQWKEIARTLGKLEGLFK